MSFESSIFEVAADSFQSDVIDKSRQMPVCIVFWAEQMPESVQMKDALQRLVAEYAGKFALGLADVARDQSLAQHLKVQALPALRIISDGQIVEQADGPQEESDLRKMLDTHTASSSDNFAEQLGTFLAANEFEAAQALVQQALLSEPNNIVFQVENADLLVRMNQLDAAAKALDNISEEFSARKRPAMRLSLAQEAAEFPSLDELQKSLEQDPDKLDIKYQCALRNVTQYNYEEALELCLSILQSDRKYKDDIGRTTMIRIFDLLEKENPLVGHYRRRMFTYLH